MTLPRVRASAFALSALLAVSRPARAAESVAATLQRQTQELVDAIAVGDSKVWDRYLDPDIRFVDESGAVMTKAQMVEGTKPLPAGVSGTIRVIGFDAAVHGDVAVATYIDDEDEIFHGHKLHCQYRSTDTWKKTGKGWRLIASQVLALRTDPPAVTLPASLREQYCGRYTLDAVLSYEIRCHGEELEGLETGHKAEVLRAEAPDVLFVPGRPRYRYVFLRGGDGKITGFAQRREAWDLVWERTASKP